MKAVFLLCLIFCVAAARDYCPTKSPNICIRAEIQCCDDFDCEGAKICCSENCGNICQNPVSKRTTGRRVPYDQNCEVDPSYQKCK